MRVVNRKEFLSLPAGTLYQKFTPDVTEEFLAIKEETCGEDDWFYEDINSVEVIDNPSMWGISLEEEMDIRFHTLSRDGCYDQDQLFLVWNKEDVSKLIKRLQEII